MHNVANITIISILYAVTVHHTPPPFSSIELVQCHHPHDNASALPLVRPVLYSTVYEYVWTNRLQHVSRRRVIFDVVKQRPVVSLDYECTSHEVRVEGLDTQLNT